MLLATGDAFQQAADAIIPFIQPDDPRSHSSIFAISNADDAVYSSSPEKMLDLLTAVVGGRSGSNPYGLAKALDRLRGHAPALVDTMKFQRLLRLAMPGQIGP
jgi:hypothetical protein